MFTWLRRRHWDDDHGVHYTNLPELWLSLASSLNENPKVLYDMKLKHIEINEKRARGQHISKRGQTSDPTRNRLTKGDRSKRE